MLVLVIISASCANIAHLFTQAANQKTCLTDSWTWKTVQRTQVSSSLGHMVCLCKLKLMVIIQSFVTLAFQCCTQGN